ncbi:hypothetical protein ABT369_49265 [Dactylosporangium sp. NPDC000244]|uniref:hypothetical protein n=1 Tax=Dactylosporangium sp. NPDC000244 TaxID=3154365 RepID=UPI00331F8448
MDEPALDLRPVTMELEKIEVRAPGDEGPAAADLGGRVSVGGPIAVPIAPDSLEGELRTFALAEASRYTYHMARLALSLTTGSDDPPFTQAVLTLLLSSAGTPGDPPVAWSMAPERVVDAQEATDTFKFAPELKMEPVSVSLGSVERQTTVTTSDPHIRAHNLLTSDPAWHLYATTHNPLAGVFAFRLVLRCPVGVTPQALVSVSATVRERRLLWYRSRDLPPTVFATTV